MSPIRWLPALVLSAAAGSASAGPLTFGEALARASATAPSLQAEGLRVEAARAEARAAGALPDPRLTLGLENVPISGPMAGRLGGDEMTMARIGIMQDMPSGAARRALGVRARAGIGAAEAGQRAQARTVKVETALAWIDLYFAERRLAVLDDIVTTIEPVLETAPASVAAGETRPGQAVEPAQVMADFADRRSELAAEAGKARAALMRWTGDADPRPEGPTPIFEVDAEALRAALASHPTLLAIDAAAGQADADLGVARAGKRPDWSWEVAYQRRDPMFGDMVSAGVTMSLPIFAGRRQDPVIAARAKDASRVRIEREAARRELIAQLEADLSDHVMHHEQMMRSHETLVPLARKRADLETASYGAGRAGLMDVADAFTALADARLEALDREAATARDAARLALTYGSDDR